MQDPKSSANETDSASTPKAVESNQQPEQQPTNSPEVKLYEASVAADVDPEELEELDEFVEQPPGEKLEELTDEFLAKLQAAGLFEHCDTRKTEKFMMRLDSLVWTLLD